MRVYAGLTLLAAITACDTPVSPDELLALREAEARWAARGFEDYAIETRESCFCRPELTQWSRVEVVDGLEDRVTVLVSGAEIPANERSYFPTVEEVFNTIRRSNQQDWIEEVIVEFDPQLGFPTRVELRPKEGILDAGITFYMRNASQLRALPSETDWRRELIGAWVVEFRLDSVIGNTGWQAGSLETTTGTFEVFDPATAGWGAIIVRSTIDVEFGPLLERPMSCFDPRPASTAIQRQDDQVSLAFTPHAADCGFSAHGTFFGDSVVGSWSETSFIGPIAKGRFRMTR